MKINAISTSDTRPKTTAKPVSFGRINSIHITRENENQGQLQSEGDLSIYGRNCHWKYYVMKKDDRYCTKGLIKVQDPINNTDWQAICSFPDDDLSNPQITEKNCYLQDAPCSDEEAVRTELLRDARTIIITSAKLRDSILKSTQNDNKPPVGSIDNEEKSFRSEQVKNESYTDKN